MRRISARPVMGFWPIKDRDAIQEARFQYDSGLIEMVQRREGDWFVLYAVDRARPVGPRNYFFGTPMEAA